MSEAPELSDVLADNIARLRHEASMSQTQLARLMRWRGLIWNRATVAQIETHRRQVAAVELLALFDCFAAYSVQPDDFFRTEAPIVRVGASDWKSSMPGNTLRPDPDPDALGELTQFSSPGLRGVLDAAVKGNRAVTSILAKWKGGKMQSLTVGERDAIIGAGPDEVKAAKRLEVSFIDVAAAAFELYGHSMIEERDERVTERLRGKPDPSPRTTQALRGHVMRQLDREILDAIYTAEDRAATDEEA